MINRKWLKLLIGCVAFGVLMGIRQEFSQMWLRAMIAALAGGVLGVTMCWARMRRA